MVSFSNVELWGKFLFVKIKEFMKNSKEEILKGMVQ